MIGWPSCCGPGTEPGLEGAADTSGRVGVGPDVAARVARFFWKSACLLAPRDAREAETPRRHVVNDLETTTDAPQTPRSTPRVMGTGASLTAVLVALLGLAMPAQTQATHHVDALGGAGAHTTIQAALDVAASGDTVLVAPGLYAETIDFLGKDVALLADGGGGPATHVIDPQAGPGVETGPVVTLTNGVGPGALLQGFTITGGLGGSSASPSLDGTGGVCIDGSPTIRDCHIVANQGGGASGAWLPAAGHGGDGGLAVCGGSPVIENCEFRDNVGGNAVPPGSSSSCGPYTGYSGGAGGAFAGKATITDCLFSGNQGGAGYRAFYSTLLFTCQQLPADHGPGALRLNGGTIDGCVLSDNIGGTDWVGAIRAPGGILAGSMVNFSFFSATGRITNSEFHRNVGGAVTQAAQYGAGLSIEGCVFSGNAMSWREATVLQLQAGEGLRLVNCAFVGNSGGPVVSNLTDPYSSVIGDQIYVAGCVFAGNDQPGFVVNNGTVTNGPEDGWNDFPAVDIVNSILWGNAWGVAASPNDDVSFSCLETDYGPPAPGNIVAADPLFVRAPSPGPDGLWATADDDLGDLRLQPGSPALDAGSNGLHPLAIPMDMDGNVRFHDDIGSPDTGVAGALGAGAIVDMGCFESGAPPSAEWDQVGEGIEVGSWPNTQTPSLGGSGSLQGGMPVTLFLDDAAANAPAHLVVGLSEWNVNFKQGVLVPSPDVFVPLATDATGSRGLTATWPAGLPSNVPILYQYWIQDPAGPVGYSASNGLRGTTP